MPVSRRFPCRPFHLDDVRHRVAYLGSINYHLLGTPQFAREWLPGGLSLENIGQAPILVYNRKDASHKRLIEIVLGQCPEQLTVHYFPAVERFTDFIVSGLACGMCDITADEALTEGTLIDLAPPHYVKLKLYWHSWNLKSSRLERFSAMLIEKTREILLDWFFTP